MHQLLSVLRVVLNHLRFALMKVCGAEVVCLGKCTSRLNNEWAVSKNAELWVGEHVSSLNQCRFLVRGGKLKIGNRVGFNSNCVVACHDTIDIGDGTEIGPNVCIYDHDHDFRCAGGLKAGKFRTAPVIIGKNVWIGANVVVLRGATIGDNCVLAAGSIVRGVIPDNTVYYAASKPEMKHIEVRR